MARLPRLFIPHCPMVCALQAMPGQAVWGSGLALATFKNHLPVAASVEGVQLHAYGLVQSQALLMLTPTSPQALARFVQALRRACLGSQGQQAGAGVGSLWQARFKSAVVQPDAHALAASWWVCSLPWRSGLVGTQADNPLRDLQLYPGSSYAVHAGLRAEPWLADWPAYWSAYWALGNTPFERQSAYQAWCQSPAATQGFAALGRAVQGGWLWSSDAFYESAKARANRHPRPRAAGRPVKL